MFKTKRDGTLTIAALAGGAFNTTTGALLAGAKSLDIDLEPGDFNYSVPGPTVIRGLDRGEFTSPPQKRYGDDQPITLGFTKLLEELTDAAASTLLDIINQEGYVAANWQSTLAAVAGCAEVFTVDIRWKVEGTDHCDANDYALIFRWVHVTGGGANEGDQNTITFAGESDMSYPIAVTM